MRAVPGRQFLWTRIDRQMPVVQMVSSRNELQWRFPRADAGNIVRCGTAELPVDQCEFDKILAKITFPEVCRRSPLVDHGTVRFNPRLQGNQVRPRCRCGICHLGGGCIDQMLDCRAPARAAQCFRIATHPVRIAHVKRLSIAVSRMAQDGAAIDELCHVFTGDIVKPEAVAGKPVDGLAGRPRVAPCITKSCGSSGGQSRFIVRQVQGG